MELLNKISIKGVYGSIDVKSLHTGGAKSLMRVLGVVNSYKVIATNFGDSVAFMGNIKATNLETGEEFRSGKAFLPAIASVLIEGALNGEHAEGVQFAFDVGVKPVQDRQGKDSYEYTVKPLIDTADNDPLKLLEEKINTPLAIENKVETKTETKGKK